MLLSNVIIVAFGSLNSKENIGSSSLNYKIAKKFFDEKKLAKIFCLDYDENIEIDNSYIISLNQIWIFKVIFKILNLLRNLYPKFSERLVKEFLFDIYCSYLIKKNMGEVLLSLKPVNPLALRRAKKINIYTITLGTIAHPIFNYNVVKSLQDKYNLPNRSTYTNLRRIRRVCDTFKYSDKIIPIVKSKFIRNTYILNGIEPSKLDMPLNNTGLEIKSIKRKIYSSINDVKVKFMTLAHLNLIKGIPLLLEAWEMLKKEFNNNCKLIVAGKADTDIKEIIERYHKHTDNIEFTGYIENIIDAYTDADVFIAPSVSDNGPWTIIEAMAVGLPVIASSHCGFAEYIEDGKDGFIYDPFDTNQLKNIMRWFIENKSKISIMGFNARRKAENFEINDFSNGLFDKCISFQER